MLLAAIDEQCRGTYDFLYLPIDFKASIYIWTWLYVSLNKYVSKSILQIVAEQV